MAVVDDLTRGVSDGECEIRLLFAGVVGVLLHQRIPQNQQVVVVGVDMQGVGDALLLCPRQPVAQPY